MAQGTRGGFAPTVRQATDADLDELVRLHALARDHVTAERGGTVFLGREARPLPAESSLADDISTPGSVVLLGCLGEVPVGFAIAATEQLHDGGCVAHVAELYVEPDARCVGTGAALMERLVEWASAQGCVGIGSTVLPGDRASKSFFESFGLVARAILVHRDLR